MQPLADGHDCFPPLCPFVFPLYCLHVRPARGTTPSPLRHDQHGRRPHSVLRFALPDIPDKQIQPHRRGRTSAIDSGFRRISRIPRRVCDLLSDNRNRTVATRRPSCSWRTRSVGHGVHDASGSSTRSRQVISYDPRGSGLSQVKASLAHYTVSALVAELEAVREHVAKAESVVVIARGFGAAVAVRYAREYPGRVDRFILLSPMPPDGTRYDSILDLLGETAGALTAAGIRRPTRLRRTDGRTDTRWQLIMRRAPISRWRHASHRPTHRTGRRVHCSRRWPLRADGLPGT